jgi:2-dehydro-3-deoxyphosphogluconate aldolase / (4S)-4-hydroxy-2-oxoglutarate aldolase
VTTRERAEQARAAGASFLVTPHVAAEVNAFARDHALPVLCGVTTPSEIAQALEQGCPFVKLFPAGPLGASYLRALTGPYPGLEVFAVGGVASANARAFLEAGAIGLGIGGALTSSGGSAAGLAAVSRAARELVGIMTTFRAEHA